jgi:hypothetical protein
MWSNLYSSQSYIWIHKENNVIPSQEYISFFPLPLNSNVENISEIINSSWGRLKYKIPFHIDKLQHLRKLSKGSRVHWNKFRKLAQFLGLCHLSPPRLAELRHSLKYKLRVYHLTYLWEFQYPVDQPANNLWKQNHWIGKKFLTFLEITKANAGVHSCHGL